MNKKSAGSLDTAKSFIEALESHAAIKHTTTVQRITDQLPERDIRLGVRMRTIFSLAKTFIDTPLTEVETLLESPLYEARMGGVSIMDFQARQQRTTEERRRQLFELYIGRHDRINDWGLVDRSAPYVVGGYLFDKSRKPLYRLANSKDVWERRTAIVSTYYFIRLGDVEDTFNIAVKLLHDDSEFVQKPVGSWLREAGKKDETRLKAFILEHGATMPRVTLRYAIEKFDKSTRDQFLALGKSRAQGER